MKDKIKEIVNKYGIDIENEAEFIDELLILHSVRLSLPDRDAVQDEAVRYVEENNERVKFMDTAYYEHLKLERILDLIYNEA